MIRYHAAWILPIGEPPIRDGWLAVDRGRVVALGSAGRRVLADGAREVDLGDVAILPGLVNAHTHLELSYLRDEVPPASEFVTWIRGVMAARRQRPDPKGAEILDAVDRALVEAVGSGTALVGDISNTLVTFAPLTRSPLAGVVFYELIRFNAPDPAGLVEQASRAIDALAPTDRVRASLAAHAPYSVAPLVFRAMRRAIDRRSVRAVQRPSVRVGGGGRVHPDRPGSVARAARGARRLGSRVDAAGRLARCSFSTRAAFSTHACSPSTASR